MKARVFKMGAICLLLITILGYARQQNSREIELEEGTLSGIKYLEITDKKDIYFSDDSGTYILHDGEKEKLKFNILTKIKKKKDVYIVENKKGKVGIFNKDFKSVIAFNYDRIVNLGETEFILGENEGKKYLVNIYDYSMIGPYDEIELVNEGKLIKITSEGKSEYLDGKGREIPLLRDKDVYFWRNNIAVVRENEKYGLVDLNTGKVVESNNSEIFFSKNNILRKEEGIYYLNDKKLDIGRVYPSTSDVVIFDKGNKFGILNLKDLVFFKETYDEVMFRYSNYIIVGNDGKYGVMNKYAKISPELKYLYIIPAGIDAFAGGSSEEKGLVALIVGDKQVTEEKYEGVYSLVPGYYFGENGDRLTLLDKNGVELINTKKEDIIYYNKETLVIKKGDKQLVFLLI